jgi:hypothetical protein
MKKAIQTSITALLALTLVLALPGCGALKKAQELQAYEFGADSILSVNAVVGERKVTGVSAGTANGAQYKEYTYESSAASSDLIAYIIGELIKNGGWTALVDFSLNELPGTGQIAAVSKDEGKILIMDISYKNEGYAIKITKTAGTLTPNS